MFELIKNISERATVNISVVATVLEALVELDVEYMLEHQIADGGPINLLSDKRYQLINNKVLERKRSTTHLNNVLEIETKNEPKQLTEGVKDE